MSRHWVNLLSTLRREKFVQWLRPFKGSQKQFPDEIKVWESRYITVFGALWDLSEFGRQILMNIGEGKRKSIDYYSAFQKD